MLARMAIVPDTKNWTWVLERACPDCGFDSSTVGYEEISALIRDGIARWESALARPGAASRPDDATWSPLEYAAHVRDAQSIFLTRLTLVLTEDDPLFANWDQDATAEQENYGAQDPAQVAVELRESALRLADAFEAVPPENRGRTGRRSDGAKYTVDSLARYYIHDPIHHLWDVER